MSKLSLHLVRSSRFSMLAVSLALFSLALSSLGREAVLADTQHERVARLSGGRVEGGDPNATGRAVLHVRPALSRICFRITFRRLINPNYGSIHSGSKQYGGPLEVTLFNGDRGMRESPIEGCARDLPRDILRKIKEDPWKFYVELDQHTYADSIVRGRLHRPNG